MWQRKVPMAVATEDRPMVQAVQVEVEAEAIYSDTA